MKICNKCYGVSLSQTDYIEIFNNKIHSVQTEKKNVIVVKILLFMLIVN